MDIRFFKETLSDEEYIQTHARYRPAGIYGETYANCLLDVLGNCNHEELLYAEHPDLDSAISEIFDDFFDRTRYVITTPDNYGHLTLYGQRSGLDGGLITDTHGLDWSDPEKQTLFRADVLREFDKACDKVADIIVYHSLNSVIEEKNIIRYVARLRKEKVMRTRVVLINKKTDEVRKREPKDFYTVSIPRKLENGTTTVYDNFYELEFENGSKERHSKMEWELYEYRK